MDTHMEFKQLAENFGNDKGGACSDGGAAGDVSSSQVAAVLERVQHSLEQLPGRPFTLTVRFCSLSFGNLSIARPSVAVIGRIEQNLH